MRPPSLRVRVEEELVMNRALTVAALVVGLLVGYAASASRIEAQGTGSSTFPFMTGDTVKLLLEIEDRGGEMCTIEGFRGTFVICKNENGLPFAFNLEKVFRATQVAKHEPIR
jgi:hypothetical protein